MSLIRHMGQRACAFPAKPCQYFHHDHVIKLAVLSSPQFSCSGAVFRADFFDTRWRTRFVQRCFPHIHCDAPEP
jgi:hypothetical protein